MKRSLLAFMLMLLVAAVASAGTVTGTVIDSTGAAVEGAQVNMRTPAGEGNFPRYLTFRALTGADGTFILEGVPEGMWPIRAAKRLVGMTVQNVEVPAEGEVNVDLVLPGCTGEGERPRERRRILRGI